MKHPILWRLTNTAAEVPIAGKMLCTEEKLSSFLTWDERANMLAGNTIDLFNLGPRFEKLFQRRLVEFKEGLIAKQGNSTDQQDGVIRAQLNPMVV